jgi:hypothetical protein
MSRRRRFVRAFLGVSLGGSAFFPAAQPSHVVVTHADDPSVAALAGTLSSVPPAPCVEGGNSGRRVSLIYARLASDPDAYTSSKATIREAAAQVNAAWRSVAGKDVRWLCNSSGQISVGNLVVSSYTIDACKTGLQSKGYRRTDRIYVCLMRKSAKGYGGQAQILHNADKKVSPSPHDAGPRYAAIYSISTSTSSGTLMHEFGHTIGAVQCSAPHSSCPSNELGHHHCYEESDTMCYSDGGSYFLRGGSIVNKCLNVTTLAGRWDCGKDDYFNRNPAPGTYLATHWNTYNSLFLWPN